MPAEPADRSFTTIVPQGPVAIASGERIPMPLDWAGAVIISMNGSVINRRVKRRNNVSAGKARAAALETEPTIAGKETSIEE